MVTDNLTITLFASDASPEVKNASGTSTINWGSDTIIQTVESGDGNDNITGEFSSILIYGGKGSDTISSGAGNDTIAVANDGYVDNVNCGNGLFSAQDNDFVSYGSFDIVSNNCEQKQVASP